MISKDSDNFSPAAELRETLLQAAFALLDEHGMTRVSVRGSARRLGVAPSAAARCFPNRKAMLTDMATATLRELARIIGEAHARSPRGPERWRTVGGAVYGFANRAPHRYALCWRFDQMLAEDLRLQAAGEELCARLREALADRPCEGGDALLAAGSLLEGYVALRHSGAIPSAVATPLA